jgi:hypothetical protein
MKANHKKSKKPETRQSIEHRNSYDQPGFGEKSTKKNARRVLKKQEKPAPKKEPKVIQYKVSAEHFEASKTKQQEQQSFKEPGLGKGIRKTQKQLKALEASNKQTTRKYRRLADKLDRLELGALNSAKRKEEDKK